MLCSLSCSRFISAPAVTGTWRQKPGFSSAPLSPAPILNRRWLGAGRVSSRPICLPLLTEQDKGRWGRIKILEWWGSLVV